MPLYGGGAQAGFPSPVDDYIEGAIDLNKVFVKDKACSFYVRVAGDSMTGDGIFDGDLLLVDRSIEPFDNCIAVCYYDGGFSVKRVLMEADKITLMPSNPKFKPVEFKDGAELVIWGVVRSIHRSLTK